MHNPQNEENNGFGPIFKRRGSNAKWASVVILVAFTVVCLYVEQETDILMFYASAFVFSLFAWIIGELFRRLCLSTEELKHRGSRYNGSTPKAFKTSFDFDNVPLVALVCLFAVVFALYSFNQHDWEAIKTQYLRLFLLNSVFIPVFAFLFGLRQPSRVEYSQFNEKENKNLANGLAWSFYFGYLKFVLPELTNQINLTKEFRNKIDVHKVFIVIPKNCFVFDKISNPHSDPKELVKCVGNLEPLTKDRGGIQKRVYQHSVHCIKDEITGKEYHCVMEYATPLMTLHEMSDDPKAGLSREERDAQVNLFLGKLKAILDDDDKCRGKYELVTLGGHDQEIGKIMISAIKNNVVEIGGM